LFHSGPLAKKVKNRWEVVAIGPTTSSRMNPFEPGFIEKFRVSAIIGKGGMDDRVVDAMRGRTVYLAMTGGCAATAASRIKKVQGVEWLELGEPEAVWALETENLGPLVVAIDAYGNSLYKAVNRRVSENLKKELEALK